MECFHGTLCRNLPLADRRLKKPNRKELVLHKLFFRTEKMKQIVDF